jgi:hypothetical protein
MSDQQFWSLVEELSEPAGTFTLSENLVSNEPKLVENLRWLRGTGGVYIGVGPEQNFSYIAGLRPRMAFIVDIRRENRNLHLLYKALFAQSSDRVDFVSRLFSRTRPPGLEPTAGVEEIFARYADVAPSDTQFDTNRTLVREWLVGRFGAGLAGPDLDTIDTAYRAFFTDGPEIQFWGSREVHASTSRPTYRQLMTTPDATGRHRSFLATDEDFTFVKDLHSKNMIVPLVGDFGGPTTIQRVGDYVRERGDVVAAFYASNVAVYLNGVQTRTFCGNLATLPFASRAWFIDSDDVRTMTWKLDACRQARRP